MQKYDAYPDLRLGVRLHSHCGNNSLQQISTCIGIREAALSRTKLLNPP